MCSADVRPFICSSLSGSAAPRARVCAAVGRTVACVTQQMYSSRQQKSANFKWKFLAKMNSSSARTDVFPSLMFDESKSRRRFRRASRFPSFPFEIVGGVRRRLDTNTIAVRQVNFERMSRRRHLARSDCDSGARLSLESKCFRAAAPHRQRCTNV